MGDPHGIYYLGPKGSFTYEAALSVGAKLCEKPTITEVFESLLKTEDSLGVVPLQNSLEGPVNETLDGLFNYPTIYVNTLLELEVRLVVAAKRPAARFDKLYSHQHALREVKRSVLEALGAKIVPVESTSQAAVLASGDQSAAAICSRLAAKMYGLQVVADNVQLDNNITQFAVVSRRLGRSGQRTMALATVPHRPGGLLGLLEAFYSEGINLTMIYSRPLKGTPWHYYFLLEFEGSLEHQNIQRCLAKIPQDGYSLRICGSYPVRQVEPPD